METVLQRGVERWVGLSPMGREEKVERLSSFLSICCRQNVRKGGAHSQVATATQGEWKAAQLSKSKCICTSCKTVPSVIRRKSSFLTRSEKLGAATSRLVLPSPTCVQTPKCSECRVQTKEPHSADSLLYALRVGASPFFVIRVEPSQNFAGSARASSTREPKLAS